MMNEKYYVELDKLNKLLEIYKFDTYKSDFYAFSSDALKATKVTDDRHQLLLTVGLHF